jgi:4,5-DOPA dioxygenase extradiol
LYKLSYSASGAPEVAQEAARLLEQAGLAVGLDERRGLDHGAWVPLFHLLPKVNLPVFQVSMPVTLDTAQAVKLGQALAALREQGVLIVASGSMTHNLYEVRQPGSQAQAYAQEFTAWVRAAVLAKATQSVVAYRSEAPHAERAHPTDEHFLPLLIAMGATDDVDTVRVLDGGITYGVISMESYVWGLA